MKNNLLATSIIILGVCIALGCWFIAGGMKEQALVERQMQQELQQQAVEKQLLSEAEVAEYLGLSVQAIQRLTKIETGPGSYTHIMPFIEIDTIVYYPKKAVDEWLTKVQIEFVY